MPNAIFTGLTAAQPYFIGIGLPLLTLMVGIALPVQFAQQQAIGEIKANVEQFRTDIGGLKSSVDTLNRHLSEKETDPTTLLAKLLGASEVDAKDVPTVLIDGALIAFPRTQPLKDKFVAAGYPVRAVSPTISGFTISLTRAGASVP